MTKTKIELSNHYHEILEMIKYNKTPKFISNYLEDNYNEKISVPSIYRFKKNRYNKLVVAEADRIRKNEIVDNTGTVVEVDCVKKVANQFNELLKLNDRALSILNEKLFNNNLSDVELISFALKCLELSSKYSFKQYFNLRPIVNEENNAGIALFKEFERAQKKYREEKAKEVKEKREHELKLAKIKQVEKQ